MKTVPRSSCPHRAAPQEESPSLSPTIFLPTCLLIGLRIERCLREEARLATTNQIQESELSSKKGRPMWDLGCIVAAALFFLAAIAYTSGCDRLGQKDVH